MAKELEYEDAFGLVKEMAKALAEPSLQAQLGVVWEAAPDEKAKRKARSELLMPFQTKIIEKFGYEASQKGMMQSTMDFFAWNHIPEIHELNGHVNYYLNIAYLHDAPTLEEVMSQYPPPPVPHATAKSKPFTLQMAIEMQEDLIASYSSADFQQYHQLLREEAGEDPKKRKAALATAAMEKAQSKVMPKWGFEASQKGVIVSMQAFNPYNDNLIVQKNNNIVSYYMSPELQEAISLEEFLKKAADEAAAKQAQAPKRSADQPFTLQMAIEFQEDLIAGYSAEAFQEELKKLVTEAAGDAKKRSAAIGNTCMERVQTKVFPKWGFDGSRKGTMASMQAFGPYNDHPIVAKNNMAMSYYTNPEWQIVSLEEFLTKALQEAAKQAQAPAAAATPASRPAVQQAKPGAAPKKAAPRVPAQVLKESMRRKVGKSTSGVQRIDGEGQNAGWAPSEFIDEVCAIYENGGYLAESGDFAGAEPVLREALMFFEEIVGEGHTYTLLCANQLCFTLHQLGRFPEGEPLGKRSMEGFKRMLGKRHEHTVAAMNNYALCCQGNQNMATAVEILKEVLTISEEVNGPNHNATLAILSNLAETVRLDGNNAEAMGMFLRCYKAEAKYNGSDTLPCSMFANNLAVCARDQDNNDQARYWYERAVAGLTKYYGADHEKVKLVQKNLKELVNDPNPMPLEMPRFLMVEPRKASEHFYDAAEQFAYKPMCNFSAQASKDFGRRLLPIEIALRSA